MVTKMTGFNKSAYNKSNFDYEEVIQEQEAENTDNQIA